VAEEIFGDDGRRRLFRVAVWSLAQVMRGVFREDGPRICESKEFDDFGAALYPTTFRGGERFAVVQASAGREDFGRIDLDSS